MEYLLFSKGHIWISEHDGIARLGITDYAQDSLGSILFVNLPDEGEIIKIEEKFGDIESVKTVSDLISPVEGEVISVNEEVIDEPEGINDNPYDVWLIEIKLKSKIDGLMNEEEYTKYKDNL